MVGRGTGGGWGKGAAIGFQGSFKSAPTASLHHNISITSNLVSAAGGPALEAASVDGLTSSLPVDALARSWIS
jgi:hypothetical protein